MDSLSSGRGGARGGGGVSPHPGAAGDAGNPYSRDSVAQDYGKRRKSKKRRRILVACLVLVLVAVLGAGGAAFAYLSKIQGHMQEGLSEDVLNVLSDTTTPGGPFYMVLMGVDRSADREASQEFAGDQFRSDSLMLVRVDPQQKKVAVVSLMRDTMIDMGENGVQKLNAAHALGGPAYTVEVVSDMAGVPISHYAEIDFEGFKDIVDAIGGIDVEVPIEINDADAGGHLDAGMQTLNGEQALILCRSRYSYDELGKKGDEFRAANQRLVISAIVEKILQSDVGTMLSTVEALSQHVTTDMSVTEILTLANDMRGIDMETGFYSAVNPTTSEYIDDIWWEIQDDEAWKEMMRRIDQGLPPVDEALIDPDTGTVLATSGDGTGSAAGGFQEGQPRTGTVAVRNGTSVDGVAAAAQEPISALGYTTDTGNADSTGYAQTIVVYETPDQEPYAQEIVNALGVGTAMIDANDEYLFDADFLVVIGADWQQ